MVKRLCAAAQLVCWAAFFALWWFGAHKMGVQRHLIAQHYYWSRALPLLTVQWACWGMLTLLSFCVWLRCRRPWPFFYGFLGLGALFCPVAYRPLFYTQGLMLLALAWFFALVGLLMSSRNRRA